MPLARAAATTAPRRSRLTKNLPTVLRLRFERVSPLLLPPPGVWVVFYDVFRVYLRPGMMIELVNVVLEGSFSNDPCHNIPFDDAFV